MKIFLSKAQKRRHQRQVRLKAYLISALFLLVTIGAVGAFLKLPIFHIAKFDVPATIDFEELRGGVLSGSVAKFLGFANFLSWPSKVGNFSVRKDYFASTLTVILPESDRFAIWCGKECYWVDRSGIILEKALETEGSVIPQINGSGEFIFRIGSEVIDGVVFGYLAKVIDGLRGIGFGYKNFNYNDRLQELIVSGVRGEKLIFSARFAPTDKIFGYIKNLSATGKISGAEYLDFTVENRIYFKNK